MKKFLMAALMAMGALASFAAGDCCANGACSDVPAWKQTLGKVQDLTKDTGISGFMMKEAPAYITGNFGRRIVRRSRTSRSRSWVGAPPMRIVMVSGWSTRSRSRRFPRRSIR